MIFVCLWLDSLIQFCPLERFISFQCRIYVLLTNQWVSVVYVCFCGHMDTKAILQFHLSLAYDRHIARNMSVLCLWQKKSMLMTIAEELNFDGSDASYR